MTTVSDGLFQYGGLPVSSPYFQAGNAWFVKPSTGSDGNSGKTLSAPFKTLAKALASATANKNQVVYLISESDTASATTDYQAVTLDWNKDLVHLVGIGAAPMIGSRCRIAQLSTVKTMTTLLKISANNCLIANLEIFQGVATSTATLPIAMEITGERNKIVNCQISGMGDTSMDVTGGRSLKISGQENEITRCFIGLDTVLRATNLIETEIAAGARILFEDCFFETYTSSSSHIMMSIAAGVDRYVMFKNCIFDAVEGITSAVAPTAVFNAVAINGKVLLMNPMISGFTNATAADNSCMKLLGLNGLATGHLLGIAQSVDAA